MKTCRRRSSSNWRGWSAATRGGKRARLTLRLLRELGLGPPARVLDAGCGWGVTLDALEGSGYQAIGLDISRRALERLDRPGRTLIEADLARPFERTGPVNDAVLALDVIEHLDDDRSAVRRLGALVQPAGRLIVSVPPCRICSPSLMRFRDIGGDIYRKHCVRPSRTRAWHRANLLVGTLARARAGTATGAAPSPAG